MHTQVQVLVQSVSVSCLSNFTELFFLHFALSVEFLFVWQRPSQEHRTAAPRPTVDSKLGERGLRLHHNSGRAPRVYVTVVPAEPDDNQRTPN